MIDLDELERLAKAAGAGQWSANDCTVWFDDGDGALRVGPPAVLGVAFDNMGKWPDPIDREDVAAFVASVCPAATLALIAETRRLQNLLDCRPAVNAGLIEAFSKWTGVVYDSDVVAARAAARAKGKS